MISLCYPETNTTISGKPIGWSFLPNEDEDTLQETGGLVTDDNEDNGLEDGEDRRPSFELVSPQTGDFEELPRATRDQVNLRA